MNTRSKVPIHSSFTGAYLLLAIVTLLPTATASKASLLGYKAFCSFTPLSTLILVALADLHLFFHRVSVVQKMKG